MNTCLIKHNTTETLAVERRSALENASYSRHCLQDYKPVEANGLARLCLCSYFAMYQISIKNGYPFRMLGIKRVDLFVVIVKGVRCCKNIGCNLINVSLLYLIAGGSHGIPLGRW